MIQTLGKRLRSLPASERGWALVTAMVVMTIMMGSTLGLAAYLDGQTQQTGVQRTRESAFNLSEAALNQQVWALGNEWPGAGYAPGNIFGNQPYSACTPSSATTRCPAAGQLRQLTASPDTDPGATWETRVVDNVAPYTRFYSDPALRTSTTGWDSNGDGFMWVRATAQARQRARTLVALVREETQQESLPRAAIIAGGMTFTNNGEKALVQAGTTTDGFVGLRCQPSIGETDATACEGYPYAITPNWQQKVATAIQPVSSVVTNYPPDPAVTAEALERFKAKAWSTGTYYNATTGCPSTLTGEVVVIDVNVACTIDGGTTTYNSEAAPGIVILLNSASSLTIAKNSHFWGVIYHANLPAPGSSRTLVTLGSGCSVVHGGILIDGPGRLSLGSCGDQVQYTPKVFDAIRTISGARVIRNTWRELKAGS